MEHLPAIASILNQFASFYIRVDVSTGMDLASMHLNAAVAQSIVLSSVRSLGVLCYNPPERATWRSLKMPGGLSSRLRSLLSENSFI